MPYRETSIIFDLDGTLVDSAPDLLAATNNTIETLGFSPVKLEIIRSIAGKGARAMIARALEYNAVRLSDEELDGLLPGFINFYRENIAVHTKTYEGVESVLEHIRNSGGKLGVCTNKKEDLALKVLEQLDLLKFFDAVVGADTLEVRKPHPGHILGTVERVGGNPDKAIMIGDSSPDIEGAKAAGIPVIAVSFGYTDKALEILAPDAVISHFSQLPEVLFSFLHNTN